ncbi:hypothetical protein ARMSODRAFT_91495 [Armillaria solidipes]|uniref:Uncharacterized protein n=1 Tax=Armillaria solidipes TaxID=1076256 RepID=A0A2H3BPA1_9AGAR|nr:hypothetical protein ARMSODRAFT_91495 [Armillaria solidipes]
MHFTSFVFFWSSQRLLIFVFVLCLYPLHSGFPRHLTGVVGSRVGPRFTQHHCHPCLPSPPAKATLFSFSRHLLPKPSIVSLPSCIAT